MFSFLPQVFIIIAIAGIIVILLKKDQRFSDFFNKTSLKELLPKVKELAKVGLKKLWQFVLEIKEISKSSGSNARHIFDRIDFRKIHFPKPKLPFSMATDDPGYVLTQGQIDLDNENYEEAERKFIKVISKDPKNELAYAGLGRLYLILKKFNEAAETYKFLVKHFSENDTYWANLGRAYHGQKLYDQAIEAYEKAIALDPQNARRYVNIGLTLEAKKHIEEAILNYREAVSREKNNVQFLMVLSEALVKKGEKEEAQTLLEEILVLEPTNHVAREKLMELKF